MQERHNNQQSTECDPSVHSDFKAKKQAAHKINLNPQSCLEKNQICKITSTKEEHYTNKYLLVSGLIYAGKQKNNVTQLTNEHWHSRIK
jgi:hypothetical protein